MFCLMYEPVSATCSESTGLDACLRALAAFGGVLLAPLTDDLSAEKPQTLEARRSDRKIEARFIDLVLLLRVSIALIRSFGKQQNGPNPKVRPLIEAGLFRTFSRPRS